MSNQSLGLGYDITGTFFDKRADTDVLVRKGSLEGLPDGPCHFHIFILHICTLSLFNLQAHLGYLTDKWH